MQVQEIHQFVERNPFRPFRVRLNNGVHYQINNPRDVGAPKDYHIIVYFSEKEAILIDAESIVEIIEAR